LISKVHRLVKIDKSSLENELITSYEKTNPTTVAINLNIIMCIVLYFSKSKENVTFGVKCKHIMVNFHTQKSSVFPTNFTTLLKMFNNPK